MIKSFTFIGFSLLLISGCGGGGDNGNSVGSNSSVACGTGNPSYFGCWITPGCQSVQNPVNDQPVWGTIRYNFASNGNLYDQVKIYTNSSCSGTPVYDEESFTDLAFSELGTETLQSGLSGYRLRVEDVTTSGQGVSEVLVAVTSNNQLCLSNNLQLTANGYAFILQTNATDVDLVNNCLDRI